MRIALIIFAIVGVALFVITTYALCKAASLDDWEEEHDKDDKDV